MSNKLNKSFMFYGNEKECVFGYPFKDNGFSGTTEAVLKKAILKYPQYSIVFKILIPSHIPFFYDAVLNKFRIIAGQNFDINQISEYITKYYTEFKNVVIIDQFCSQNKISNFDLPLTEKQILKDISCFLAINDVNFTL